MAIKQGAVALGSIVFSRLPYEGEANSTVDNGNSIGHYDSNGHLVSRQDYKGRAHYIKEYNGYYIPHTHRFKWKIVIVVWAISSTERYSKNAATNF